MKINYNVKKSIRKWKVIIKCKQNFICHTYRIRLYKNKFKFKNKISVALYEYNKKRNIKFRSKLHFE